MIKSLVELNKTIDTKVDELVEKIKGADPTTKDFTIMLENFSMAMTLSGNIARLLESIAKEEKKDESNN